MKIEILNWTTYNPRTDSKKPTWFRLENDIATGPGFFELDCEQKWLWVVILSLVSQKNGQEIEYNSKYVKQITGISIDKQHNTIDIFEKFARLRVSREVTLRDSHATNERTNERTYVLPDGNTTQYDFKLIIDAYPKRKGNTGKADAMKKLKQLVKCEDDFNKLLSSATNYATECRKNGNYGTEFVAMASTFFGKKEIYKEWVDYSTNSVYSASDEELLKAGRGY